MKVWRAPHKIVRVQKDERVYVWKTGRIKTGQKVHFERFKPFNGGPTEWTIPENDDDIVVLMDPETELYLAEITDNRSQPSHWKEALLPDAIEIQLPSR